MNQQQKYIFPDKVAIKVVDRAGLDAKALRMLSSEIATLECVHHPNILRYVVFFWPNIHGIIYTHVYLLICI